MDEGERRQAGGGRGRTGLRQALADIERDMIREALERTSSLTEAAACLEVDLSTLSKKRKKYGL